MLKNKLGKFYPIFDQKHGLTPLEGVEFVTMLKILCHSLVLLSIEYQEITFPV